MRRTVTLCSVASCDRAQVARGLCLLHYKRQRTGKPLEGPATRVGDPDGYGTYGVLDRGDDGVLCHECGEWYRSLGAHSRLVHGMTAAEYRAAHGRPRRQPLVSRDTSEAMSTAARGRIGSPGWQRLEAARDPQAAADSRQPDTWRSPAVTARRAATVAAIPPRPRAVRVCVVCGTEHTRRRLTCSPGCERERRAEIGREQAPRRGRDEYQSWTRDPLAPG